MNELLRKIPKVDDILKEGNWSALIEVYPESLAKDVLRSLLDNLRSKIKNRSIASIPAFGVIIDEVRKELDLLTAPTLKRVINGTGVIVHTNLGRSLLSQEAKKAIANAAASYVNLEYDLSEGARGDRYDHCSAILKRLTGAEDALVVNNNAGAVFLILNTMAEGREAVISRGELVEIGGSFRIPDVMKKSGVTLKEVGTTNRTYPEDFERVISDETALLMKAHTSNYRIKGFTREIGVEEIVDLGKKHGIPTYFDAGSGLLFSLKDLGIHNEPIIVEDWARGFDIISFSGDKVLGGPQAGIILGKASYIGAMKRNPMARALRADKFTLAGLEATLLLYLDLKKAKAAIPTLKMLHEDKGVLRKRAERIVKILKNRSLPCTFSAVPLASEVGGGTLPDELIPSFGFAVTPTHMSASHFEERLRNLEIPIIGRIEKERVLIDMRTILKEDEAFLISGIETALKNA